MRPSESGSRTRTKFTYVKVPMKANRMQKPIPKAARSFALRKCADKAASGVDAVVPVFSIGGVLLIVKVTRAAPARLSAAKK